MTSFLFATNRESYRRVSLVACLLLFGLPLAISLLRLPFWTMLVAGGIGFLAWMTLLFTTYGRLKDAGLWGGLAVLLFFNFRFGPVLFESASPSGMFQFKMTLGELVSLIPVVLGCIAVRREPVQDLEPPARRLG